MLSKEELNERVEAFIAMFRQHLISDVKQAENFRVQKIEVPCCWGLLGSKDSLKFCFLFFLISSKWLRMSSTTTTTSLFGLMQFADLLFYIISLVLLKWLLIISSVLKIVYLQQIFCCKLPLHLLLICIPPIKTLTNLLLYLYNSKHFIIRIF